VYDIGKDGKERWKKSAGKCKEAPEKPPPEAETGRKERGRCFEDLRRDPRRRIRNNN